MNLIRNIVATPLIWIGVILLILGSLIFNGYAGTKVKFNSFLKEIK